ncbi:MAG: 50S ribosomal protein L13 [Christensenellales bacterium]
MKTYMPKSGEIDRKWYLIDAKGMVLGRLASEVASILRGKNKPVFTPNTDMGDYVVVINTDDMVLTGKKLDQKMYTYHTGYVGGLKQIKYSKLMAEKSDFVLLHAVKGMLPKNSLGRSMIKKLHIYKGAEHKQAAQQPELIQFN